MGDGIDEVLEIELSNGDGVLELEEKKACLKRKKNSRRSTVCMHLLMRQNKGKIKLSNNACPDWLIVYLESWPKGFGTPPLFHVYFYGIYS